MKGKRFVTFAGFVLVGFSFYYIALQLAQHREGLAAWRPDSSGLAALAGATLIYALANYALTFSWIRLLICQQPQLPETMRLISIYGRSQIAKYVPGNILHIGGRHALGKAAGISHKALVFAAFNEIIGLLSAAAVISLLSMQFLAISMEHLHWLPWVAPVVLVAYFVLPYITSLLSKKKRLRVGMYPLSSALVLYFVFFISAGSSLSLLVFFISSSAGTLPLTIALSAFTIAWCAGYITPGSPSGLGIRESVLIFLLTPVVGVDEAIILSLLCRLVTVLGDVVFFVFSTAPCNYSRALQ